MQDPHNDEGTEWLFDDDTGVWVLALHAAREMPPISEGGGISKLVAPSSMREHSDHGVGLRAWLQAEGLQIESGVGEPAVVAAVMGCCDAVML